MITAYGTTRIRKDSRSGWWVEVWTGREWSLKRWTAGNKRDARKAEAEVREELSKETA